MKNVPENRLILLLFLFLFIPAAEGIIGDKTMLLRPGDLGSIAWFGFASGGDMDFSFYVISVSPSINVRFYICSPSQYTSLVSNFDLSYCNSSSTSSDRCEEAQTLKSDDKEAQSYYYTKVMSFVTYNFALSNCGTDNITAIVKYTLENPGGEQLSAGVLEIKYLMIGFSIAWGFLLVVWIVKWITVRMKKANIVQVFLIANCIVWGAFAMVFYAFLEKYSQLGVPDSLLLNVSIGLLIVSECFFFSVTQMICSGLGIRKPNFQKMAFYKVAFNVFLLIFCYFLYVIIGTTSFYLLSVVYFFFLVSFVCDIQKIIREIRSDIEIMLDSGIEIIDSQAWHQIRFYRTLIISLVLFLPALSVISATHTYYYYMPWIGIGAHIFIIYNCSMILSSYLRFQKDSPYTLQPIVNNRT